MSRIELSDTSYDALIKIIEGNPGAARAITDCMEVVEKIDSDSLLGAFGIPINLDSFEIYGSHIWILYKDICGQDAVKMIAIIRAMQMGIISVLTIKKLIEDCGVGSMEARASFNHEEILMKVQECLPNFAKEYVSGQS